ncbi:sister chromatid cohesion protein PDS5 homolog D isoform X2 [Ricinus communis]|uniref:sister chromatid cohesion protein PDS5 homolog D isoform X2 n=1 Tax=Ricinus communis TaxID=3988 RepID=UPI000772BC4A|nr:sister chromatid cohesion protein PDS5 homolog D isoform X2 [Ricinus communis]|eukprot:XP_015579757.1 uncharacterized protein LOC8259742 isoform X2 [Ricinus communis]
MVVNEIELEQQLKEAGNRLLNPPSSIDELLNMLDKLEHLLINVEQAPSKSMQDALLPSMKALISNALLRNSDPDVKVSVVSCLSEFTRITAPDPPYNDDHMKEIFELTVAAFEKLSHVSSRCYMKAVSILDTVARVRSCLIMLDLELDELIIKIFQHFLKIIRSNHPHAVFLAMETIMTLIINESDTISMGLLTALLASVRKENQSASPIAWKLGEKVIVNSAAKLKPYIKEALHCDGRAFDEYAPIIASICQDESHTVVHDHVNGSRDHLVTKEGRPPDAASPGEILHFVDGIPESTTSNGNASARDANNGINDNSTKSMEHCPLIQHSDSTEAQGNADIEVKLEMEQGTVPRKRGWKPNSLMNPEEGYDHCWIPTCRKGAKVSRERKLPYMGIDLCLDSTVPKKHVTELVGLTPETSGIIGASTPSPNQCLPDGTHRKKSRPKKNPSNMNQDADSSSLEVVKVLNTESREKAKAEYEVSLRKPSERRSNIEVKLHKQSRKIGIAAKTAKWTSLPSANLLSDEKDDILNEPEERPVHQSTQIGVRNSQKGRSLVQTDARKISLVIGVSNVRAAEESRIKKSKSSDRDGNHKEEIPNKKLKRKRTPRKEVPPVTPDFDEQLIGSKVKIWWPKDKMFYEGVVDSYDRTKKKHRVLYADGDEEILNLKRERWELVRDDILSDKVQVTDIPKADSSSDKSQPRKVKKKSELAKQLSFNLKRSGAASISKRKARTSSSELAVGNKQDESGFVDKAIDASISKRKARTSNRELAVGNMQEESGFVDKSIDGTSGSDSVSEGEGKNFMEKLNIRSTMIDIKSKQTTLGNASSSGDGSPKGAIEFSGIDAPKLHGMTKGKGAEQPSISEQQSELRSVD